jgi:pimeloyl-ACP methyl ester carboxylesterase
MQNDVLGAYDWLAEQSGVDRARFALVGASVGASVALQYAAHDRSVDALVCLSPGLSHCGIDSAGDMRQVTGRKVLLLATEDERDAPYTLKAKGAAGVEVKVYRGDNAHGTDMFGVVRGIEKEIADYLKEAVGGPTTTTVYGSIERDIYHPPDSGWVKRISPSHLRYYSSPQEAETRGLRATKSKSPRSGSDEPEDTGRPRRKSS